MTTNSGDRGTLPEAADRRVLDAGAVSLGTSASSARTSSRPTRSAPAAASTRSSVSSPGSGSADAPLTPRGLFLYLVGFALVLGLGAVVDEPFLGAAYAAGGAVRLLVELVP